MTRGDGTQGGPGVAAKAIALLILISTAALVPFAIWLAWVIPLRVVGIGLGLLILAIVWVVRPRRVPLPHGVDVELATTPTFEALLDETSSAVGAARPGQVRLIPGFGAAVMQGRGGRVLVLGTRLWLICSPAARVALVARSIAQAQSKATRDGALVTYAFAVLRGWDYLLGDENDEAVDEMRGNAAAARPGGDAAAVTGAGFAAHIVLRTVGVVPLGLGVLLRRNLGPGYGLLTISALEAAVRVGGPQGARDLNAAEEREAGAVMATQRASTARDGDVLGALRGFAQEIRPAEGDAIDPAPAGVELDDATSARIDEELGAALTVVARQIRDEHRS